jgi:hypothetical protein
MAQQCCALREIAGIAVIARNRRNRRKPNKNLTADFTDNTERKESPPESKNPRDIVRIEKPRKSDQSAGALRAI